MGKAFDHPLYRQDIDGLRAVAILSVVLFHAFPSILPSGFIGVDIFFVISGFLISSIIFKGVEQGSFTFSDFYSRRIKRIFPSLSLVLTTCLCVGWFSLFADEYQMLGKHVASGAMFVSNFTLLNEAGYFDPVGQLKPLLHLWSLGIEEQFYIVWPLLIYLAARLRINLLVMTVFLVILSFGLNIVRIDAHLVQTFYGPITRFWELMLGALLAYMAVYHIGRYKSFQKKFGDLTGLAGFVFVVVALLLLNSTKLYPSWWAVLPTVGAMLLIAAGPAAWINKKVLALRPLVFVGLISYPLYLWHWTLLSFLRITESSAPSVFLILIAILISFILAWMTYALVEKRVRYRTSSSVVVGLLLIVGILGLIGKIIQEKSGLPLRSSVSQYRMYEKQMIREADTDAYCVKYMQQGGKKRLFDYCRANNLEAKKWIAIIGDSHAHVLFPGFSEEFEKRGMGTILLANSSCPPYMGTATGLTDAEQLHCSRKIEQILSAITQEKRIEKVLIATRGPVYMTGHGFGPAKDAFNQGYQIKSMLSRKLDSSGEIYLEGLYNTIDYLSKSGKKIAYFLENPELGMLPKNCLGRPLTFSSNQVGCNISFRVYKNRMDSYRTGVASIKNYFPDMLILDPEPLFCDKQLCTAIKNNRLLYADDDHLSVDGSRYVGENMITQLLNQ